MGILSVNKRKNKLKYPKILKDVDFFECANGKFY